MKMNIEHSTSNVQHRMNSFVVKPARAVLVGVHSFSVAFEFINECEAAGIQ